MLIRSATFDRYQQQSNTKVARELLFLVSAILIWLACGLTLAAQEAQPAGDNAQPAAVNKAYDAIEIAKEFLMPPDLDDSASRDEQRANRTQQREVRDRIRAAERSIKSALEGSGNLAAVEGGFENFMQGYVFPRMTQTDRETLSTLGEIRDDFINDYLSENVLGGARQQVMAITIPAMQAIFENAGGKNYHEAVRLNAILLLGMIDAQPASRDNSSFPSPPPQVFDYLVDVFTGTKYPAYLKIGALTGIQRQVEIDHMRGQPQLPSRDRISQEAVRILQTPAATDAEYWLQRRSLQTLGYLGEVGSDGAILAEIIKIADDNNQKKWLRFDAITALGELKYDASVADQAKEVPVTVARYTAEMLDSESTAVKNKLNDLIVKNLLFEDLDLQKKGNADQSKGGGRSDRGGGIGAGGGSSPVGDDAPPGAGSSGPLGGSKVELGPRVELANYHLNDARLKVKVLAFTARKVISTPSLATFVDKPFVESLSKELDTLIVDSDVGIKDLDETEIGIDPTDANALAKAEKANTIKMVELFADYANRISSMIPEKPMAAKADSAAAPAEDPLSKGNN
jgi:hypothetical protein